MYNAELKKYQDQASQLRAGIEYSTKELERLCGELSKELGITVTPENIESIREERLAKIENTLKVGNEILNRIKSEEIQMGGNSTVSQMPRTSGYPNPQPSPFNNLGSIPGIFSRP